MSFKIPLRVFFGKWDTFCCYSFELDLEHLPSEYNIILIFYNDKYANLLGEQYIWQCARMIGLWPWPVVCIYIQWLWTGLLPEDFRSFTFSLLPTDHSTIWGMEWWFHLLHWHTCMHTDNIILCYWNWWAGTMND